MLIKGTITQDFQATINGVSVSLKKGDVVEALKKHMDGQVEIVYQKKIIKIPGAFIEADNLPIAQKKSRGISIFSKISKRVTLDFRGKDHKHAIEKMQTAMGDQENGSTSTTSTPQPGDGKLRRQPSQGVCIEGELTSPTDSMKDEPLEPEQQKEAMSEESAKLAIIHAICGFLARKRLLVHCTKSPDLKDGRLRRAALLEILSTERTYVKQLNICMSLFYEPLKQKKMFKKVNDKAIETMFSNMEQVKTANEMLFIDIEKVMEEHPTINIGMVFARYLPFFKLYTTYVNNFDAASALVEQIEKKDKKFFEFSHPTTPEAEGLTLSAYLVAPVQRIPRYRLLLQELIKRTPSDHVDYKNIELALGTVVEVANFVNESKRREENSQVTYKLQEQLKSRFETLLQPHRFFVKKGRLEISCDHEEKDIKDWYNVYLFNDMLICTPEDDEDEDTDENCEVIYFAFTEYHDSEDKDKESKSFVLESFHRKTTFVYTFTAETPQIREEWESDISLYIVELQKLAKKKGIDNSQRPKKDRVERKRVKIAHTGETSKAKVDQLRGNIAIKQKKLNEVDENLRKKESEYETIWNAIQDLRNTKEKIVGDMAILKEQSRISEDHYENYLSQVKQHDTVIWQLLNGDMDAFKEIFEEDPVLPEEMLTGKSEEESKSGTTSQLEKQNTKSNRPVPRRGENPYVTFFMMKEYDLLQFEPFEDNAPETETETLNTLFAKKPMKSHFKIEQENIPYKYKVDRIHYGDIYVEKPPTLIPFDSMYDNEDLYENDLKHLETQIELPDNVEKLKETVLKLMEQVDEWKAKYEEVTSNSSSR